MRAVKRDATLYFFCPLSIASRTKRIPSRTISALVVCLSSAQLSSTSIQCASIRTCKSLSFGEADKGRPVLGLNLFTSLSVITFYHVITESQPQKHKKGWISPALTDDTPPDSPSTRFEESGCNSRRRAFLPHRSAMREWSAFSSPPDSPFPPGRESSMR